MILLHNPQSKESREFYSKYRSFFDSIINYPKCVESYPDVNHFPAVVYTVPETIINNSLHHYLTTKYPDYKRRARYIGELIDSHTEALLEVPKGTHGSMCTTGGIEKDGSFELWFKNYAEAKGWTRDYLLYLVEVANCYDLPAFFLWWAMENNDTSFDTGIEYHEDLSEFTKQRSIKGLNEFEKLIEIIPEHDIILYPESYEDLMAKINDLP